MVPKYAAGSGLRLRPAGLCRDRVLGSSQRPLGFLRLPPPGRQGPVVLSALAPSVAGLVTAATPVCRPAMCRAGDGLHGNIFRTTTRTIVPMWQFSAAYSAVTLSSVEDDGLGEELRVLLAHSMRGHHTAKARRHDPPGPRPVKRG
jgi:hypothetical protein